jgi:hypothetical protein
MRFGPELQNDWSPPPQSQRNLFFCMSAGGWGFDKLFLRRRNIRKTNIGILAWIHSHLAFITVTSITNGQMQYQTVIPTVCIS